jgi:hypothetical protein
MKKKNLPDCLLVFILLFTNVNFNGNEVRDENTNKCENEREDKKRNLHFNWKKV